MKQKIAANEIFNNDNEVLKTAYHLEDINFKIAEMAETKRELEERIIALLAHAYDGSKSYDVGDRVITCTTRKTLSLDKKLYQSGKYNIPEDLNPVEVVMSYKVNKVRYAEVVDAAPKKVRAMLKQLITVADSKLNVAIKARKL